MRAFQQIIFKNGIYMYVWYAFEADRYAQVKISSSVEIILISLHRNVYGIIFYAIQCRDLIYEPN